MSQTGPQRLTSWKEIAAHLGRDVRTVLRWEKERSLPVHRIPGATGRVVFAYTDELDAWSRGRREPPAAQPAPEGPFPLTASPVPPSPPRTRWWLTAAVAGAVVAGVGWPSLASRVSGPTTLEMKPDAIVAVDDDGTVRWRHPFAPGERAEPLHKLPAKLEALLEGGEPGWVVGSTARTVNTDTEARGGQLYAFSRDGALRRTFAFEDRVSFEAGDYGSPWVLRDFQSNDRRLLAVAGHHFEWWPSLVTVLDDRWNRRGTFVNAGWVESVVWSGGNRLVIAGFSNAQDGGMVALLDADALEGQSPAMPGSAFRCASCGDGGPIRYLVMPRSEVNRASAAPFNRARVYVRPDGFLVRTIEVPTTIQGSVDVLYEFTKTLHLVRATYSDHYWEVHRELETGGRITHAREHCPDRDGPREIRAWEPAHGWVTQAIVRSTKS